MEISELRAFVTVIQTGSFTQAANRLDTHKAHVSRLVSSLEAKLGVQLLQRSTRALSVTEIGQAVYERAVGIVHAVEDTERLTHALSGEPSGTLRLTASPDFGRLRVNEWVNQFLMTYPKVQTEVEYTGRLIDLVHEGFDLAIRIGTLQDSNLVARHLGDVEYGLFASPSYIQKQGTPETWEDLSQHARLQMNGGAFGGDWVLSLAGKETRIRTQARLKLNDTYGLCDAALMGLGIARLPLWFATPWVHRQQLIPILSSYTLPSVPIHAVFPSNRYLAPKVRCFIDLAVKLVQIPQTLSETPFDSNQAKA